LLLLLLLTFYESSNLVTDISKSTGWLKTLPIMYLRLLKSTYSVSRQLICELKKIASLQYKYTSTEQSYFYSSAFQRSSPRNNSFFSTFLFAIETFFIQNAQK
jgi:hypothetical protein